MNRFATLILSLLLTLTSSVESYAETHNNSAHEVLAQKRLAWVVGVQKLVASQDLSRLSDEEYEALIAPQKRALNETYESCIKVLSVDHCRQDFVQMKASLLKATRGRRGEPVAGANANLIAVELIREMLAEKSSASLDGGVERGN